MKRMVIDIETLAVPERLPPGMLVEVVQVGVVVLGNNLEVLETREWNVQPNGACDESTVRWALELAVARRMVPEWVEARREGTAWSMENVLGEIAVLWGRGKEACGEVWSKGAFDVEILRQHYGALRRFCPWKYHEARDLRTLMKSCGVHGKLYDEVAHTALADAMAEAEDLRECLGAFGANATHDGTSDQASSVEGVADYLPPKCIHGLGYGNPKTCVHCHELAEALMKQDNAEAIGRRDKAAFAAPDGCREVES